MGAMKLWRREARKHNLEEGKRHQGRKNKPRGAHGYNGAAISDLMEALLKRAGVKFQQPQTSPFKLF